MTGDNTEQKEEHRIGTINRWDAPDADWAAEYDWTRFRGPDPWPVPGGWTFGDPEEGGWWIYFGDAGVGHGNDNSILDELQEDESIEDAFDAMNELREEHGERASLAARTANPDEVSMMNPDAEELEWELKVDGAQVFRRVEPDRDDLMGSVAAALEAYHEGREDRFEEIVPETGRKPDDVLEQEKQERREEENDSLDEFVTDGGEPEAGSERLWDHADCPRDGCEGELQDQGDYNVMCLSCNEVFTSYCGTGGLYWLQDESGEKVAEKKAVTDGGARFGYSMMTDTWYRVTEYDDLGDGQIRAKSKEKVPREEVPQDVLDATTERSDRDE